MDNKLQSIGIRLTAEEKNKLQRKAHESYKTVSQYIRDLALKNNE